MWHRTGTGRGDRVSSRMVGVLLVTWAATIGPRGVLDGDGPEARSSTPR